MRLLFTKTITDYYLLLETHGIPGAKIVATVPRTRAGQAAIEAMLDALLAVYDWPVEVL